MIVSAVVVAGGAGSGIDVLMPLAGTPMIVRSVRVLLSSDAVTHVVVVADGARAAEIGAACAGLPVDVRTPHEAAALIRGRAHAAQRPVGLLGDGPVVTSSPDVVLVHDAARPLAPPELVDAVLDAVRAGCAVAVPVLPSTDTVKIVDAAGLLHGAPDRACLRVVQTPQAFRVDLLADDALLPADRLLAGAHTVPGDPLAFAVRSDHDLALASLLVEETR